MKIMRDDVSWLTILLLVLCLLLFLPLSCIQIKKAGQERQRYQLDEQRVKTMYLQEKMDEMERKLEEKAPKGQVKQKIKQIPQNEIRDKVKSLLDEHREEYLKEHPVTKKTKQKYMEEMYYFIESKHVEGVSYVRLLPEYSQIEFVTENGCFIYLLDTE